MTNLSFLVVLSCSAASDALVTPPAALAGPLILMMLPSCDAVRVHGSGRRPPGDAC